MLDAPINSFEAKIDVKDRLAISTKIRESEAASKSLEVLTLGFGGCLVVLTRAMWDTMESKLGEYSITDGDASRVWRTLKNFALPIAPDAQWRFQIPDKFQKMAGITAERRDVIMMWMRDRLEIWERTRFDAYMRNQDLGLDEVLVAYEEVARRLKL